MTTTHSRHSRAFTIVEIIIAITMVSIMFGALYSATNLLFRYIDSSNGSIAAMNLAVSGVERFRTYATKRAALTTENGWTAFVRSTPTGFYTFSGSAIDPVAFTGSASDYGTWEGPLDERGDPKPDTSGLSFYRLVGFMDYAPPAHTFDAVSPSAPLGVTDASGTVLRSNISYPILQSVSRTGTGLLLTFTPGFSLYSENVIFVYRSDSTDLSSLSVSSSMTVSTGALGGSGDSVASIAVSGVNVASGDFVTLSGVTFRYGLSGGDVNVPIGASMGESLHNLQTAIGQTLDDYRAYYFTPTAENIAEKLRLSNGNLFSTGSITSVHAGDNVLSIEMGNADMDTLSGVTIIPTHLLRFATGTVSTPSANDFTGLESDKTGGNGVSYVTGSTDASGVSSTYQLSAKVIIARDGAYVDEESVDTTLGDTPR